MPKKNDEVLHRTGSFRRVIPSGNDTTGISGITVDSANRNTSYINANYVPFFLEYTLMSEFNILSKKLIPGVYVIPAAKTPFIWFGVIFPKYGLYKRGVFRFRLLIDSNWPECDCPKVIIDTPLFHPLVNSDTGEMNIKHYFPEWKKGVSHIWHVIDHLMKSFYEIPRPKLPANPEAAELLKSNDEKYFNICNDCIEQSKINIYKQSNHPESDDPNYLHFDHYNEEIHGPIRNSWFQQKDNQNRNQPLSWVQPGSLEPFSRQNI